MNIRSYGTGERIRICEDILSGIVNERRVILLPIPSSRDGVTVSGTEISLAEVLRESECGDVTVGYSLPREYSDMAKEKGVRVVDLSVDEEFLIRNAELTAHGTVGYILSTEKKAPTDLSVGIIGYGRIGKRLLRYLLFFGAHTKVYTGNVGSRVELCSCGVETALISGADFTGLDILINTAPAQVIQKEDFPFLPAGLKIIDLASGNYLKGAPGLIKLSGIPEAMYPVSSGRLLADAVKRHLEEESV